MSAFDQCLPSKVTHFFKIILRCTLGDGKVRIPIKFSSRYGGGLSNPVFLKLPDGTKWEVYWIKEDGKIWFQKGWKEFAEYYCLDHGHLVVFKFEEGTSDFEVIILDMSASEIDYGPHATHDDEVEVFEEMPKRKKRNSPKSPLESLPPPKKMRTATSDMLDKAESKSTRQKRGGNMEISNFHPVKCARSMAIRSRRKDPLSSFEKARALESLSSFSPKNPFFKLPMQPSYIFRGSLRIPSGFSRRYFTKKQGAVLLKVSNGRTWSATYRVHVVNNKLKALMQTGWKSFATDNSLEVGDVCVFELIKNTKITFKVHIFQAAEKPSSLPSHDADRENPGRAPHNNFTAVCPMTMTDVEGLYSPKKDSLTGKSSRSIPSSPKVDRGIQTSTENAAILKASSFKFEYPYFRVVMQKSYLNKPTNLYVPTKFAMEHLISKGNHRNITLQTLDGRAWRVKCKLRIVKNVKKTELSVGWGKFAVDNDLLLRDVCVFELIKRSKVALLVTIIRASINTGGGVNGIESDKVLDFNTETVSASNGGKATLSEKLVRAQEQAKSFISENPFFKVNIRPTLLQHDNSGTKPTVPAVFLRKFMKSRVRNGMIQLRERSWPVKLRSYPHFSTGKLSDGWRRFAEESKLQLGDVCIFELIDRESAVLKVHIFRCHAQVILFKDQP